MASMMLNKPTQMANDFQNQLMAIAQQAQRMGPQNLINQILSNNPQLAQNYQVLMQANRGMSPTQIATWLMQQSGIDPSILTRFN
jgi:hypothetical protein